jgi:CheY-like chemotaxis protein
MEGNKILVVDDTREIRELLEDILSKSFPDKEIFCLTNGAEAWEEVQYEPDFVWVILTDWKMPQMDGIELIERIKSLFPKIPIILMSGDLPPENNQADEFLPKPITQIQQLVNVIKKLTSYQPAT